MLAKALWDKELRELFRTRFVIRLILAVLLVGGMVPAELPASSPPGIWLLLFGLLVPIFLATLVTPDLFAGERERGTLPTLLAMPVSRWRLFGLKVLAGWGLTAGSFGISLLVFAALAVTVLPVSLPHPLQMAPSILGLAAGSSGWAAALGTLVSWLSPDVRTAQSTMLVPFLILAVGVPYLAAHVLPPQVWLRWAGMPFAALAGDLGLALVVVWVATLAIARAVLSRASPI
ncbi:MAG: ABC transporter permease subunit [Firmicutes bacterium]|nr:ABC transporter permease subunit [Bacillota bacterium]